MFLFSGLLEYKSVWIAQENRQHDIWSVRELTILFLGGGIASSTLYTKGEQQRTLDVDWSVWSFSSFPSLYPRLLTTECVTSDSPPPFLSNLIFHNSYFLLPFDHFGLLFSSSFITSLPFKQLSLLVKGVNICNVCLDVWKAVVFGVHFPCGLEYMAEHVYCFGPHLRHH